MIVVSYGSYVLRNYDFSCIFNFAKVSFAKTAHLSLSVVHNISCSHMMLTNNSLEKLLALDPLEVNNVATEN